MRLIVGTLAALALVKIYTQDEIYRTATSKALVEAYRSQAIAACQADRHNQQDAVAKILWEKPGTIDVEIGRSDLGIRIWDTDHALWESAYLRPYLVLSPSDRRTGLKCTYDITAGAANVARS
ncbi:MAG: hypothetical protein APF80_15325 [Alphaproteobacteria bacterium BRH_c36]|nr:MAG: hypothetical protein APF80_15325 [Alphaproteobacteria bacterium BRH_c36]